MGDSCGGVGFSVICLIDFVVDRVLQVQRMLFVVMFVAFVLGCGKTSDVFEKTVFYFFINY